MMMVIGMIVMVKFDSLQERFVRVRLAEFERFMLIAKFDRFELIAENHILTGLIGIIGSFWHFFLTLHNLYFKKLC